MSKRSRCRCQDPDAVAILARISDKEKQTQASLEEQVRETREKLADPRGWRVVTEYQIRHRGSNLLTQKCGVEWWPPWSLTT